MEIKTASSKMAIIKGMENIRRSSFAMSLGALLAFLTVAAITSLAPSTVLAYSNASLSLSNNSVNDTVVITANGYPDSAVEFYYYYIPSASSSNTNANGYAYPDQHNYRSQYQSLGTIGYTDQNGYFSTVVNSNQYANEYGIYNGADVYVNINGQTSSVVTWQSPFNYPSATSYSSGVYPYGTYPAQTYPNTYYSNAYPAQTYSPATYYQVPASSYADYSYYSNNNYSYPYSTYPNGYPGGYSSYPSNLSFSQTDLTLTIGQTAVVTAYNNNAYMYVYNDSNPPVATASINNVNNSMSNQIDVYANTYGTATFIICNTSSVCGNIFVTVEPVSAMTTTASNAGAATYTTPIAYTQPATYSSYTVPNTTYTTQTESQYYNVPTTNSISFSANDLNLNIGQNQTLTISGNGGYYLAYNSNSSIMNASVSGNTLTVSGLNNGSGTLTICQKTIPCGTVFVKVANQ